MRLRREVISYLIFGVLTTAVNYAVYYAATRWLGFGVTPSSVWAWLLAVLFAYITNKLFVFDSQSWALAVWLREAIAFIGARLFSGFFEIGNMWLFAERLCLPDMPVKIVISVAVVVMNYVFSKLWIFRK